MSLWRSLGVTRLVQLYSDIAKILAIAWTNDAYGLSAHVPSSPNIIRHTRN